jgi:hypothetical protein
MDALLREWQQTLAQYKVQLDDATQVGQLGQSSFKGHLLKLMQDVRGLMVTAAKTGAPSPEDASSLFDESGNLTDAALTAQKAAEQKATFDNAPDPFLSMPFLTSLAVRDAQLKVETTTTTDKPPESSASASPQVFAPVPNLVWMYWEQIAGDDLPRPVYLEKCLESVRVWNANRMQLNLV